MLAREENLQTSGTQCSRIAGDYRTFAVKSKFSKWLFVGQLAASTGFTIYSYLVGSWVFMVTNLLLTINNIFGIFLYFYFKKRQSPKTS